MKEYSALIIDLKKSKTYSVKERNAIQKFIIHVIKTLNIIFKRSVERDVDFSGGDEVQGLFSCPEAAYLYFRWFHMLMSPVEVRAGIGIGNWNVVIEGASTTAQDGSAYHNARYAIEETRESLGYSILLYSGTKNDVFINSLINATTLIINKHSEYQNELMLLSELLYPIDVQGMIDCHHLVGVDALIRHKKEFQFYDFFKQRKLLKASSFRLPDHFQFHSVPVDAMEDNRTFFVTGGKPRGLSLQLAEIIGISRQSIEKTFKVANIYEARNTALAVLKMMRTGNEGRNV